MSRFRLLTRAEMESIPGISDPIPTSMWAVGAVDEKGLAAAVAVYHVAHADPIWVRPDLRGNGVARDLWHAAKKEAAFRRYGPEVFFGMIPDNPGEPTESRLAAGAVAAGGYELNARFFVVPIPPDEEDIP